MFNLKPNKVYSKIIHISLNFQAFYILYIYKQLDEYHLSLRSKFYIENQRKGESNMNILDYKSEDFNSETWLDIMYEKQLNVAIKYKDIEGLPQWPLSLDPKSSQVVFKDFLYRISEELSESYETVVNPDSKVFDDNGLELHAVEELADALHFYLELLIYVGIKSGRLNEWYSKYEEKEIEVDKAYLMAQYRIGMTGQLLHNKPWKVDNIRTDTKQFVEALKELFYALLDVFRAQGANNEMIFDRYCRKNKVNQFRQRSKY